jgi:hypothetical protein
MLKSCVKKALLASFLSLGLVASAMASPHTQEKQAFCETVAKNYKAGVDAKKLGMTEDELESRIVMFAMGLLQNGMPEPIIKMLVKPIVDGYFGVSSAQAHYGACMNQELI